MVKALRMVFHKCVQAIAQGVNARCAASDWRSREATSAKAVTFEHLDHLKSSGHPDNVLCLCPNHHSPFEGGLLITDDLEVHDHLGNLLGPLRTHKNYHIGVQFLQYHRSLEVAAAAGKGGAVLLGCRSSNSGDCCPTQPDSGSDNLSMPAGDRVPHASQIGRALRCPFPRSWSRCP